MISSEVQRTLVKSPPELWAELSDPGALARHLGELGEIRIVRTEPERKVEWAAQNITGTVSIQPSGWGTKVTLSVTQEIVERAHEVELQSETQPEPGANPETEANAEPEAEMQPETEANAEPEATAEPEAEADEPELAATAEPTSTVEDAQPRSVEPEPASEPRRGFFARLFGRRRREDAPGSRQSEGITTTDPPAVSESPDAFAAVRQALAQDTFAAANPFAPAHPAVPPAPEKHDSDGMSEPVSDTEAKQISDISAELMAAEEAATEEVTAVLAAVLDRLGAAHHRPFSRA
jgi:hypothetical protein